MEQFKRIAKDIIKHKIGYIVILLFIIIIMLQIKLIATIVMHYSDLKIDPFVYGAKRLGIKEANCFIKEDVILFFNQSESKFIVTQHGTGYSLENYFKK